MAARNWIAIGAVIALGGAAPARAADEAPASALDESASPPSASRTEAAAAAGAFLPLSQAAAIDRQRATATGLAGYDTARHTGNFEASTEVRLWGPVAVRAGAVYTNGDRTLRPSVGARVQLLGEARHGIDGALGVFYRPEGLTEPEGEIETALSVGRHVGLAYLLGNLLYGQDPEGRERDGEVRLALLRPAASRFLLGFDSRVRFDLGSDRARLEQRGEARFDVLAGPVATALVGPVAVVLEGGGSALTMRGDTSYGVFVMGGAGAAF